MTVDDWSFKFKSLAVKYFHKTQLCRPRLPYEVNYAKQNGPFKKFLSVQNDKNLEWNTLRRT